jgi:hypothetical protein
MGVDFETPTLDTQVLAVDGTGAVVQENTTLMIAQVRFVLIFSCELLWKFRAQTALECRSDGSQILNAAKWYYK